MRFSVGILLLVGSVASLYPSASSAQAQAPAKRRNVIIFVADGLRRNSVNPIDAPTMVHIRQHGVDFANSHAMFPTFTTPNASAIATGHYLGDSGIFSNNMYVGFPVFEDAKYKGMAPGSSVPSVENDPVLGDVDEHFEGESFLGEETLLAYARQHGYRTAAIGKLGPALVQDVTQGNPKDGQVPPPATVVIDDSTGKPGGVPLAEDVREALAAAKLPLVSPDRSNGQPKRSPFDNGSPGNGFAHGTRAANLVQQAYFVQAATRAVLPMFVREGKPFAIVYWSRDPDGTQHNQGDSLNKLSPGINGPTARQAVLNADENLKQILDFVESNPQLKDNTDIFLTADHGFGTISKHQLDPGGDHTTTSYAASITYKGAKGKPDVPKGFLPPGFLAIDIAHELKEPLYDAKALVTDSDGARRYKRIDPTIEHATAATNQRPVEGSAIIGGKGLVLGPTDARVIVAGNGGSDLVYVPSHDPEILKNVVDFLLKQDYVSGLFVDDAFGEIPGTLPLSAINLTGSAKLPRPSIVVNFRSFSLEKKHALQTEVLIADSDLQEGQGTHGGFGRGQTLNNMAAIGPDFKAGYVDHLPVSNADIAMTLAQVLGFEIPTRGKLSGRVIRESLVNGPPSILHKVGVLASKKAAGGQQTFVDYQDCEGVRYFDAAGFEGRTVGLKTEYKKAHE